MFLDIHFVNVVVEWSIKCLAFFTVERENVEYFIRHATSTVYVNYKRDFHHAMLPYMNNRAVGTPRCSRKIRIATEQKNRLRKILKLISILF